MNVFFFLLLFIIFALLIGQCSPVQCSYMNVLYIDTHKLQCVIRANDCVPVHHRLLFFFLFIRICSRRFDSYIFFVFIANKKFEHD